MYNDTDRYEAQSCVTSTDTGLVWGWDIIAPRSEDCDYVIEIGCAYGRQVDAGEIEKDFERTRSAAEAFAAALTPNSFSEFETRQTVTFEMVAKDGMVGFKVTTTTPGTDEPFVEYVYLNPSTGGDSPDVFVYGGPAFDPALDEALCFVSVGPDNEEG